ncbi:hypothetical protein JNB63_02015 [Microbacterium trichothecenolyticum]|uniref:hypothetical protein n=1 Tax=Microbacterium trichothecenolyticum TaxID=69370 RepID=UPI001C6EC603|nr:hypothetical protein [Microbacterium trichothecenolyticum]MBW9118861.1 hypothetical protein [Microbacterium trichothecenolyticum]
MTRPICPPDHRHGETTTCYVHHKCGCTDCREANTERVFYRRHMVAAGREDVFEKIVEARGTNRRLQALTAIGWTAERLGAQLGVSRDQILDWTTRDRVTLTTHERVAALYDELSDTPAPQQTPGDRHSASLALNRAARSGWARPIDWDDIDLDAAPATGEEVLVDELAVELAIAGHKVKLTREERQLAVRTLNARRYNDNEIAEMLRVASRTILRDREEMGLPANPEPYQERFAA